MNIRHQKYLFDECHMTPFNSDLNMLAFVDNSYMFYRIMLSQNYFCKKNLFFI